MAGRARAKHPSLRAGYVGMKDQPVIVLDDTAQRSLQKNVRLVLREIKKKAKLPETTLGQLTNCFNGLFPALAMTQAAKARGEKAPLSPGEIASALAEVERLAEAKARENASGQDPAGDVGQGVPADAPPAPGAGNAPATAQLPRRPLSPGRNGGSTNLH